MRNFAKVAIENLTDLDLSGRKSTCTDLISYLKTHAHIGHEETYLGKMQFVDSELRATSAPKEK